MTLFNSKEQVLDTFIKKNLNNDIELIKKIEEIFPIKEYDILKKTYFLYFLLFFASNYKNLKIITNRIEKIQKNQYLNTKNSSLYNELFKTTSWENLIQNEAITEVISKDFDKVQKILQEKINNFIKLIIKNFEILWETVKDNLILNKDFIHSNEIIDEKLKDKALRWEYLILRKSEQHRKTIRNYFLSKYA